MFAPRAKLGIAALVGLLAAAAWAAEPHPERDQRTVQRTFELDGDGAVRIDVRYGEVVVERGEPGRVEAELRIRCRGGSERCHENIGAIDLEGDSGSRGRTLRVVGLPRFSNHGTQIELHVFVPQDRDVELDVGAGEIHVQNLRGDLRVKLGAGEIEVRAPEEAVRSVEARAGVGEARMSCRGGTVSERRHLVGGRVDWDSGQGDADLDLHVGAGEVAVELD
jgi:hypothetical protein